MNLETNYLGLPLASPLVASSSPLSYSIDGIEKLTEAGASAIVLFSLFEEQLEKDPQGLLQRLSQGTSYAEALSMYSESERLRMGPVGYLEHLRKAKTKTDVPLIASINGTDPEKWVDYPRLLQEAGADAIELNLYAVPTDPEVSSTEVERRYVELTRTVVSSVSIPVAVKLSPFFTSLPHVVRQLHAAGAKGVVLFNRFYQPDIDLDTEQVRPRLTLSDSHEVLPRLRWIAILHGQNELDLAASGGVHDASDVLKLVKVGATVTQLCSALLEHGLGRIKMIESGVRTWLIAHEYRGLNDLRGTSTHARAEERDAFERAQYLKTLESWDAESVQHLRTRRRR